MSKNKRIVIMVILLALFGYYRSCITKNNDKELRKNGKITIAHVLYPYSEKSSAIIRLLYTFKYLRSEIKSSKQYYSLDREEAKLFENKQFPVLFLESNPEVNRLLIFPDDFKEFNLAFPDSLAWVKKYD